MIAEREAKRTVVVRDETSDAYKETAIPDDPEDCPSCGNLRDTVEIRLVDEVKESYDHSEKN